MENWNKFLGEQAFDAGPVGYKAPEEAGGTGSGYEQAKATKLKKKMAGELIGTEDIRSFIDTSLLIGAGLAELIPGAGTGASFTMNMAGVGVNLMGKDKNYLGAGLAFMAAVVPGIGDAVAILAKAVEKGLPLKKTVVKTVIKAIVAMVEKIAQDEWTIKLQEILGKGEMKAEEFGHWWVQKTGVPMANALHKMGLALKNFGNDLQKAQGQA